MGKVYYKEINIVKGVAMLMVIMGHSFCQYPIDLSSTTPEVMQNIIRFAQMPVFFLASGFLYNRFEPFNSFISKKSKRIILPFIVFSLISIALRIVAAPFSHSGRVPVAELFVDLLCGKIYWFLYALMIIMVVCRLVSQKTKYLAFVAILSLFVYVGVWHADVELIVKRIAYYLLFFILGILLRTHYSHIYYAISRFAIWLLPVSVVAYVCLCLPTLLSGLSNLFCVNSISYLIIYRYIIPLIGCTAIWTFAILLSRIAKTSFVEHFGKYSLQYYLNHLLIMLGCYMTLKYIHCSFPLALWLFVFLLATIVSWCMLMVEKRYCWLRKLCGL